MKKICLVLVLLLAITGCSSKPQTFDYSKMDNEAIYQDMYKKDLIFTVGQSVNIGNDENGIDWEITATLNTSVDATDKVEEISLFIDSEDGVIYGTVYLSDPRSPYTIAGAEIDEEALVSYQQLISEKLGMTEEQLHDYIVYVGETYALPGDKWATQDSYRQEVVVEDATISTSVCTFANEQVEDTLTMTSNFGLNVDKVSWVTTYFNPTTELIDALKETGESYADIMGLTYTQDEQTDKITTHLTIEYTFINGDDLRRVGLVSGGESSFIISVEESVKNFESDGYTCTTTQELVENAE